MEGRSKRFRIYVHRIALDQACVEDREIELPHTACRDLGVALHTVGLDVICDQVLAACACLQEILLAVVPAAAVVLRRRLLLLLNASDNAYSERRREPHIF